MRLIEIPRDGSLSSPIDADELVRSVIDAMREVYCKFGFIRPWTGYIAVRNDAPVGTCAFKSPPADGRVEIAYFTFPGHEGQGIATAMARELLHIARRQDDRLTVFAQTLPEENASTAILRKLGFQLLGPVEHPDDGTVWKWELGH